MIGRTIGGYRIVEQVGMGGMATVYKAYDASTDRYVALKTLPEQYSKDPQFVERFRREAKAIAKLEHLHILPLFAYGEDEGTAYLAMRYLPAGTLSNYIREKGQMPLQEVARILNQIASALDHAHANDILHRDIKPSNVLVDKDANIYLTDFGIARMVEGTMDLTGDAIIGTPQYMSPEQCQGRKDLTPASDQYSLGVLLYEMVTARVPFQAETPLAVIIMQINGAELPLPTLLRPELSESAERVILKALAREPADRYPSCEAMAKAFAQAIGEELPVAAASPAVTRPSQPTAPAPNSLENAATTIKPMPAAPPARSPMLMVAAVIIGIVIIGGLALLAGRPPAAVITATPLAELTQIVAVPSATVISSAIDASPTVVSATIAPSATAAQPNATEAANGLIATLIAQGDSQAAINLLSPAIEQTPKDVHLYMLRGQAYIKNGNTEEGIADFAQAIKLSPELADAYVQRAIAYYGQDNRTAALNDITEAIKLRPDQADLYAMRGQGYRDANELDKALADFDKTIAIEPNNPQWYYERALAYSWNSEPDKAVSDLNKAIELKPQFVEAYTQRGEIQRWQGQHELASADFMKARELEPNNFSAYRGAVENYLMVLDVSGTLPGYDLDKALEDATQAIELGRGGDGTYYDANVFYNRGRIYAYRKEFGAAITDFTQALKLSEESPEVYVSRGYAYINASQYDLARTDFTRALELNQDSVDAYQGRVEAYVLAVDMEKPWKDYDLEAALADANAALILDNSNAISYLLRGKVNGRRGQPLKALADLNRTIELEPGMAWGYLERGTVYHTMKRNGAAIVDFLKAIELDGSDSWTYVQLGDALYDAGQKVRALRAYQTYVKMVGAEAAVEYVQERIAELGKTS